MAVTCNQVTITTSPTAINDVDEDGTNMALRVMGTATVYLGDENVTSDTGLEVENDDGIINIFIGPNEILYGIVASDTGKVSYAMTLKQ